MFALGSQRALFDIPTGTAYFNTAYNGPLLNASRAQLIAASGEKSRPWERTPNDFFAGAETVRRLAAKAFGAQAEDWAIIPAASYGLSAAARAIEPSLSAGDRILLLQDEFPSNVLPWRRSAEVSGATIETVPTPEDGDWTSAVLSKLNPGVRVAAVSHCHWTNGAVLDLNAVAARCREIGSLLVVDATQSLGAMPLDIRAVDPDIVVAAGYKWLLCPYGFGLMYVAPRLHSARPLEETWLVRAGSEDFAGLADYSDVYRPGARRFDVGETCVGTVLAGATAALEQISAWSVDAIAATLADINTGIANHLESLGFRVPPVSQRAPHMFGATLDQDSEVDLAAVLRGKQVYVSRRGRALRFSPHLHVTEADVEQLFLALSGSVPARP